MEVIENYKSESWNRSRGKINTIFSLLLGLIFFFFNIWDLKIIIYKLNHNVLFLNYKTWDMFWRKWRRNKAEILKEMPPTKGRRGFTVNVLLDPYLHAGQDPSMVTPIFMVHETRIIFSVYGELSVLNEYVKEPNAWTDSFYKNIYLYISILLAFLMSVLHLLEF